ncbi:Bicarbonate transport ATP-binding protein CmpD [Pseudobythopirellula maris]|uniref:Bicarbonate transport ATP-binding protein CmpD n=1 Tax=Pseudobythopirellula maris TaxID=2527991 RepID=A0A5C5ZHG6_9BACT|nr:Bicarbonate transport ATP-binding protein CmpD [Pseudobythopirellula maris]
MTPPEPSPLPAAVRLESVAKSFGRGAAAVLDDLSAAIASGEFVSLLGPSGCGKSTVLRLVAGLGGPTAGRVGVAAAKDEVAFVFQDPTLMPWATAWDNVYLPLRLRGESRPAACERVDAALERVGLADSARLRPSQLSGGMRMRVSLARALVTAPRLLLLDEPFAALDEITRQRLGDELLGLWAEHQWTVLFVTHSVYESVYLSDRVLVMSAGPGRIAEEIAIDLPRPRDASTRSDPRYAALCERASAALAYS